MFIFETNPEVVFKAVDMTILFFFIGMPSLVLGTAAGFGIAYFLYKVLRDALIMSWCKTLIPAGIMVHFLLLVRMLKQTISVLSQLWKMV
jgi:hypothetical protein